MLAIRMQRTGRKGHAMFRIVVQDARLTPTSGNVISFLGSFDPHAKKLILNKEKAAFYLEHGAQPSSRIVSIFKAEKIKLPSWVEQPKSKEGSVKNPTKRRSTAPKTEEKVAEPVVEETSSDEAVAEAAELNQPETKPEIAAAETDGEPEQTEEKPAEES